MTALIPVAIEPMAAAPYLAAVAKPLPSELAKFVVFFSVSSSPFLASLSSTNIFIANSSKFT